MATWSKHFSKQNWLYLFTGLIVTVALLIWALRGISLPAVWNLLQKADWGWLTLGALAFLGCYWLRAVRWGTILGAYCHPGTLRERCIATFIGYGSTSMLPGYLGEAIRATLLRKLGKVPLEPAIGSIFAERLLDVFVVFLLLVTALMVKAPAHTGMGNLLPVSSLAIALVFMFILFWCAASFPQVIAQSVGTGLRLIGLKRFESPIVSGIVNLLGGLVAFRQPKRLAMGLLQTLAGWLLNGITYWATMVALGINVPGFIGALFVQSVASFAIALPSTPGYVGPFEAGVRVSVNTYGVTADTAIAYAIALRFLMYLVVPLIAAAIAVRLGFLKKEGFEQKRRVLNNIDQLTDSSELR